MEEALRWETGEHFPGTSEPLESAPYSATAKNTESTYKTAPEPRHKVLVVDDNADMRDYMQSLLAHQYVVLTAANGEEALRIAQVERPNLTLTDIVMPGMDGFALLHALRSDFTTRETPVIFLSARAGKEATIEGRIAGADDYLVKPFSARELLTRVSTHLKLAQARKDAEEEIRKSEEQFRAVVAASLDVVYQVSPDWTTMRHLEGRRSFPIRNLRIKAGWNGMSIPKTGSS